EILPCCGSRAWARGITERRPLAGEAALLSASDETWRGLSEADWTEAFRSHPRIGESSPADSSEDRPAAWSAQEQRGVAVAGDSVKTALAEANQEYEQRFQHIFIVCATGKTAPEILE